MSERERERERERDQRTFTPMKNTHRYSTLHLHPLRSRVMDMDHKLRVAMDNLIRKVRVAASSRPPPGKKRSP